MAKKSLLDRVRQGIGSTFGDETVRVVDYDDEEETQEEETPVVPRSHPHRGERAKRTKIEKPAPIAKLDVHPPVQKPVQKTAPLPAVDDIFDFNDDSDSAFDLNEAPGNDFLASSQEEYDKRFEGVPDLSPKDDKIQDVLEFAGIPASFSIATGVFLPDDLAKVFFEIQRPQGYDIGQVNHFLKDTKTTVAHYVMLLERRNQHVAQLASIIDRLQVSMMNEKLANEAAEGISIMPTSDSDNVESLLLELKLENQRLKDTISDLSKGDQLSYRERELHELLKDELGTVRREKEQLEEEVASLRAQVDQLEEESDEDLPRLDVAESSSFKTDDNFVEEEETFLLPDITTDEIGISAETISEKNDVYGDKSAFAAPDTGEDYIQFMGGEGFATHDGTDSSDDELEDDDALDNMIKDWEYND